MQFLILKNIKKISAVIFFLQFLVIKALDPDWIRIRIGVHPKMLDPDPGWNECGSATLVLWAGGGVLSEVLHGPGLQAGVRGLSRLSRGGDHLRCEGGGGQREDFL